MLLGEEMSVSFYFYIILDLRPEYTKLFKHIQQNPHSLSLKGTGIITAKMLQTSVSDGAKLQQATYQLRFLLENKDRSFWRGMI